MEEILHNSEIASMSFDKSKSLLELHWKRNANSEVYKEIFNEAIECSKNHNIRLFLSDMRKEGVISLQEMNWLELEILKRAIEHKLKRIALVFDDLIFSTVYADTIKRKLDKSPIDVRFFSDLDSARSWLLSEDE